MPIRSSRSNSVRAHRMRLAHRHLRLGYFLFDAIDMMRNFSGRQTYEIILHHITVGTNARLRAPQFTRACR